MSISLLWLVILAAPLNCGKITFLLAREMATPLQKAFVYMSSRKQKPLSRCSVLSGQNLALIRLIMRAFDGRLDSKKRVDACAKVQRKAKSRPSKDNNNETSYPRIQKRCSGES